MTRVAVLALFLFAALNGTGDEEPVRPTTKDDALKVVLKTLSELQRKEIERLEAEIKRLGVILDRGDSPWGLSGNPFARKQLVADQARLRNVKDDRREAAPMLRAVTGEFQSNWGRLPSARLVKLLPGVAIVTVNFSPGIDPLGGTTIAVTNVRFRDEAPGALIHLDGIFFVETKLPYQGRFVPSLVKLDVPKNSVRLR